MRRATAELRRAARFELRDADEATEQGQVHAATAHHAMADLARWAAGEPGTRYEKLMKLRNHEDLGKMPAVKGGSGR